MLFRQKRYGFNNELIEVYKFRSMYIDQADATAAKLVTKDDPRVTRVGRFIRKTSLDELPQLFNVVFKGNLSLVGPRPHAVQRQGRRTGCTTRRSTAISPATASSPASPAGRRSTAGAARSTIDEKIQQRVEHDLYYIENWSVLFDLYILLKTPFSLLRRPRTRIELPSCGERSIHAAAPAIAACASRSLLARRAMRCAL